jgi:hypothetical protein
MFTFTRANVPERPRHVLIHWHCSMRHHHVMMVTTAEPVIITDPGTRVSIEEIDPELKKVLGLK